MSVDLCRLQAGVTQQFLDNPQIRPAVEQMGGEAVAEGVGVGRSQGTPVDDPANVPGTEAPAPAVEEHRARRALRPPQDPAQSAKS